MVSILFPITLSISTVSAASSNTEINNHKALLNLTLPLLISHVENLQEDSVKSAAGTAHKMKFTIQDFLTCSKSTVGTLEKDLK